MATKIEKDALTGKETTGHEWDGIKELNSPLPKWWLYVLYASILWSIVYYVLYPSIPGIDGYFKGVLGFSQRVELDETLAAARAKNAGILNRIREADLETIGRDRRLREFSLAGGAAAFADNCAPCHGAGGSGRTGYPSLADDDWLWGGTLDAIQMTLRHGVRSGTEESRASEMPAFGRDEILNAAQVADVAEYVLSLSDKASDPAAAKGGAPLYAEHCAVCHGDSGQGMADLGAPRLSDAIWLYGDSKELVAAQIIKPRHGVMPAWGGRLDETTIKMLTVYVHSLGGGQ